ATLKTAEVLVAGDRAAEAIELLKAPPVTLSAAAADMQMGDAYLKEHQPLKAAEYFQWVYYLYPASAQALRAGNELKSLRADLGDTYPTPPEEMRSTRADRLFAAGQWRDAAAGYRLLVANFSAQNRGVA